MPDFKLTLKNYRFFSDREPAVFSIGRGFTALVGPNNSGKSSLIKFFYETRRLWGEMSTSGGFTHFFKGETITGLHPEGVYDYQEIFSTDNERDLTEQSKRL